MRCSSDSGTIFGSTAGAAAAAILLDSAGGVAFGGADGVATGAGADGDGAAGGVAVFLGAGRAPGSGIGADGAAVADDSGRRRSVVARCAGGADAAGATETEAAGGAGVGGTVAAAVSGALG